jgi:hypothetical protein
MVAPAPPPGQPSQLNLEPPPPPPPPKQVPHDERTGFYFQGGLGLLYGSLKDDYLGQGAELGEEGTETVRGAGTSLSLRFGGGVGAGVVLGAALLSGGGTFDYEDDYGDAVTESRVDASNVGLMAFGQKYIGPFFLRLGLGLLAAGSEDDDDAYGGFGFGVGGGADFSVSRTWSLGFGLDYHRSSGSYDESDYRGDFVINMFTGQFTATYF